jgi:hypothetical protein
MNRVKFPLITLSPRLSFWLVSSRARPGAFVAATLGMLGGRRDERTRSETLELRLDVEGTAKRRDGAAAAAAAAAAAGGNTLALAAAAALALALAWLAAVDVPAAEDLPRAGERSRPVGASSVALVGTATYEGIAMGYVWDGE